MATLEELVIKIEAENTKLMKKLEESDKFTSVAMKNMQDSVDKFAQDAGKKMSRFDQIMNVFAGTTLAGIVAKGFSLAQQAFGAFAGALQEGIKEASSYEQAVLRLSNSLAMSGNFTQEAKKDLEDYIGTMEELTGIDDEVIAGNLAVLSSLTRLDAEGLKRVQSAAVDMAAALGRDVSTVTEALAKAANGNISALQRMGVTFTQTGDKARDFQNALAAVEQRFGGAAVGAMNSFAGASLRAQNSVGNLFQALGSVVTQNPAIIGALNEVARVFGDLTKAVGENGFGKKVSEAFITVLEVGAHVVSFMDGFIRTFEAGLRAILLPVNAVADGLRAIGIALGAIEGDYFENTKNQWEDLKGTFADDTVLSKTADSIAEAAGAARAYVVGTESGLITIGKNLDNAAQKGEELMKVDQLRAQQAQSFADELLASSANVMSGYQMQQDALSTAYESDLINFQMYKDAKLASQLDMFEQQRIMLENSNLQGAELDAARLTLEQQQAAAKFQLTQDMAKKEEAVNKQKLQAFSSFYGNLATLQQTGSKELFAIGKAAAIAQATIDGYNSINAAYKQGTIVGGPAVGAAFAAAAGAATAVQISKIAATNLRTGIDSVPGVGSQDNFPAMLAPGERVVPTKTNQDLTEFLNNQQQQPQQQITFQLNFNGPVWSNKAEAGSEIIEAINEAMDRGMGLKLRNA